LYLNLFCHLQITVTEKIFWVLITVDNRICTVTVTSFRIANKKLNNFTSNLHNSKLTYLLT